MRSVAASQTRNMLLAMGLTPLRRRQAAPTAVAAVSPSDRSGDDVGERLWLALLHACAATAQDVAALGWQRGDGAAFEFAGAQLLINPLQLRTQPGAKRALWKTLRGLRRQRLRPT